MRRFLAAMLFATLTIGDLPIASAAITAMPSRTGPADARPALYVKSITVQGAPLVIDLPSPSPTEIYSAGLVAPANAVAFGRPTPPSETHFDQEGTAAFRVTSPTAKALRVLVTVSPGTYRILAWADNDTIANAEDAVATEGETAVWSPMTYGPTQNIRIEQVGNKDDTALTSISAISHFTTSVGRDEEAMTPKEFGDAAPCQLDMICLGPFVTASEAARIAVAANSVPLLVITNDDGTSGYCSGTLLNTTSYPAPILLTANHCVTAAHNSLSSLLTFWFYVRTGCGSGPANPGVQVTGGARLLWSDPTLDGALLQLLQTPPPLAGYAGWDSSVPPAGTATMALHHPMADALKGSFGLLLGENAAPVNFGEFVLPAGVGLSVLWDVGFTEPGSSGSGLFTYSPSLNSYVLRGTLSGGPPASCGSTRNLTYYAQLNKQYPYISQYLSAAPPPPPPPPPVGKVSVVEYYNAGFDHYFITPVPGEIAVLGKPPFQDWQPTGNVFSGYAPTSSTAGAVSVCRFFNTSFAPKSSHFYALRGLGCEVTLASFPDWGLESDNLFKMRLPDGNGSCPSGSIPVYRLYNNGMGGAPNHRFVTSLSTRQAMLNKGYASEGFGALGVGMCSPN